MTGMPDEYITRAQLARRVGLSISELRRRERAGKLTPVKYVGVQPFYSVKQVEEQRSIRRLPATPTATVTTTGRVTYTGEEAAVVYEELDRGATLKDVVKITKVHPEAVMAIAASWQRIQGGMFVGPEVKAEIDNLPLDGTFPLTSDVELLEVLKRCAADTCATCKKRPRGQQCGGCAAKAAKRLVDDDV